ncbi:MAG: type II toxin-antitoxin system VapC family toxin [Candidatus Poribacteria bacterium]|nr:type II toxin-antitoxin system VapC family toxin [Candidatus Poribacteria bacterium]
MYYFYFDASALVKRYTDEVGSDEIDFIFANVPLVHMQCLILGAVEVLWICVRKRNDGRITQNHFTQATRYLEQEVMDTNSDFKTISIPDTLVLNSMSIIETHSLNSVDAIVLRSALDIATELRNTGNTLILVASDQRLLRAAQEEGLVVFNPEVDPQQTLTDWIMHI